MAIHGLFYERRLVDAGDWHCRRLLDHPAKGEGNRDENRGHVGRHHRAFDSGARS